MSGMIKKLTRFLLVAFFLTRPAFSATYMNHTRLIINEKQGESVFTIYNKGNGPVLMKIWTEKDNMLGRPEDIKTPFIVLPPIFRLEGKSSRAVRVQVTQNNGNLVSDRESLFWINTMEVPPVTANSKASGTLQVAFRTRVKLFWRPSSLASINDEENIKKLDILPRQCGGEPCLIIKNTTPLHITLMGVVLDDGTEVNQLPDDGLVTPFSEKSLILPARMKKNGKVKSFSWIDSYGVVKKETK